MITLDWRVIVLAILAAILVLRMHVNLIVVLALAALAGVGLSVVG